MRFIHLALKRFEYTRADNAYVENLANQFSDKLRDNYLLILISCDNSQFVNCNKYLLNINFLKKTSFGFFWVPYIYFLFWFPFFIIKEKLNKKDNVLFSSDRYILIFLVFCKFFFRLKFKICSDWHMYLEGWKNKLIAQKSDYLITTSHKLKKLIIDKSDLKIDKIKIVYGGIDLSYYDIPIDIKLQRKKFNLPENKKLVGYVGLFKTMRMEKGIDFMIKSLPQIDLSIHMVFVGARDNEKDEYLEIAEKYGVKDRVHIFEMQKFKEMALFEMIMDVLVIPYPDWPHFRDYGFPMKVYEYMAAKRPIVYSMLELTEEILSNCGFGYIPDDRDNFVKIINYVINKNNFKIIHEKVGLAYQKLNNLTWDNKAKEILSFLGFTSWA